MIEPDSYSFTILQGADFARDLRINRNLTGYTIRAQGRETVTATSTVFSSSTTANHLTIASATSTQTDIEWRIPAATTAGITALEGVWDMEIVSGSGAVDRIIQGAWYLSREATR